MSRLRVAAALLILWPAVGRAQPANPPQDAPPQNAPPRHKRKRAQENPGFSARGIPCPPGTHAIMGKGPHLTADRTRSRTMQKAVPARRCEPNATAKTQKADAAAPVEGKAAQPGR